MRRTGVDTLAARATTPATAHTLVHRLEPTVRHLAFYQALGETAEGTPAWRAISAGLLVLRLVDDWLGGSANETSDARRRAGIVRNAVTQVDAGVPGRAILLAVVDAVAAAEAPDAALVLEGLMAYVHSLDIDAQWMLARAAYGAVIDHAHPVRHARSASFSQYKLGQFARVLGRTDEATIEFQRAERLAQEAGDLQGALMAQLGFGRIAIERGNLPEGARLLDRVIRRARAAGLSSMEARALHDRATIFIVTHENERAVRMLYEALGKATERIHRDRLLGDLALMFGRLGLRAANRDAQSIIAATAVEKSSRWTALANLMEIASIDGRDDVYRMYRRTVEADDLGPLFSAQFQIHVGEAEARAGRRAEAEAALRSAIEQAERHRFHQLAFRAEQVLASLDTPPATADTVDREAPAELRDVVEAIAALLRGAGLQAV